MVLASLASVSSAVHGLGSLAPVPPPTLLNGNFSAPIMTVRRLQLQSQSALTNWSIYAFTNNDPASAVSLPSSSYFWLLDQTKNPDGTKTDADFNPALPALDSTSTPETPVYLRGMCMNIGFSPTNIVRTRLETASTLFFGAGSYRLSFQAKRRYALYQNGDLQYWNVNHQLLASLVAETTTVAVSSTSGLSTAWQTLVYAFTIETPGNYTLRFDGQLVPLSNLPTNFPISNQSGILMSDVKILPPA